MQIIPHDVRERSAKMVRKIFFPFVHMTWKVRLYKLTEDSLASGMDIPSLSLPHMMYFLAYSAVFTTVPEDILKRLKVRSSYD